MTDEGEQQQSRQLMAWFISKYPQKHFESCYIDFDEN